MTLVVSDISYHGIVMVGDSAVTVKKDGIYWEPSLAAKIHYSKASNIGFALWGNADGLGKKFDLWMCEFVNSIAENESVEGAGDKLATELNLALCSNGTVTESVRRGIHVAGYEAGAPCLFHVHCGRPETGYYPFRVHRDYPDNYRGLDYDVARLVPFGASSGYPGYDPSDQVRQLFTHDLSYGYIHLRNGAIPLFENLFPLMLKYFNTDQVRNLLSSGDQVFPKNSLEGKLELYKLVVSTVAHTLSAARVYQSVNDRLSAIAFSESGLLIDERIGVQSEATASQQNGALY